METLPDLCIRTIFSHVPLRDFLNLTLVCRRWEALLRTVSSKRTRVTLLVGVNAFEYLQTNSQFFITSSLNDHKSDESHLLQYDHPRMSSNLSHATVQLLSDCLKNVTQLEVALVLVPSSEIYKIVKLLDSWIDKLTSLKIYCWFQESNTEDFNSLIKSINSLKSLKSLTIEFRDSACSNLDLTPILPQLEQFSISADVEFDEILSQTESKGENLREIRFGTMESGEKFFTELSQLDPELSSKFRHLNVHFPHSPIDRSQLSELFGQFLCLTSLSITERHLHGPLSLCQLVRTLTPLSSLSHLQLVIDFQYRPPLSSDYRKPQDKIGQLPSVKTLTLNFRMSTHTDLQCHHLGWMFPQVEIIRLFTDQANCKFCGPKSVKCMGRLMLPLKKLDSLRRVIVNQPKGLHEWSKDDL